MSDRTREAMRGGAGTAVGMAIYDMLTGKLGIETAYRAVFVGVFCTVALWVFPAKKSSS